MREKQSGSERFNEPKWPDKSVANLGAMVRQETGSLVGRKPIVMKSSFRISTTLGEEG